MREDKILLGRIEDKMAQCDSYYSATHTGFLSLHERSIASRMLLQSASITRCFEGGYEEAERTVCVFLPDYANIADENPLCLIRATKKSGSNQLTHRDYLGSLVGLGIERSVIGDILVNENGADIICLEEISEFIMLHYMAAGRTELTLEKLPITDLEVTDTNFKEVTDTIASLRLDNVISSAFKMSRSKAVASISKGIVFVNNVEISKSDFKVNHGDKLVVRGLGKCKLAEVGGRSRKDRIYVTYNIYI